MLSRLTPKFAVVLAALAVAGCSMSMPFTDNEPRAAAPPPPLPAAPAGSVSAAPLPPPGGTPGQTAGAPSGLAALDPALAAGAAPVAPGAGSVAPVTPGAPSPGAGAAGAPVTPVAAATSDVEIGRTDLLGGWTIAAAGDSCQLFMTLTTWSGGYRASTRNCSNAALQKISAWNMEGRQVQLINDSGATVARLFPASKTQFNGQTEGGGPVTVSR